jgi:hypothetical protein
LLVFDVAFWRGTTDARKDQEIRRHENKCKYSVYVQTKRQFGESIRLDLFVGKQGVSSEIDQVAIYLNCLV